MLSVDFASQNHAGVFICLYKPLTKPTARLSKHLTLFLKYWLVKLMDRITQAGVVQD